MATSTGSGDYDVVVGPYNANASTIIATGHTVTLTDNVTGNNFFQIQAGATLVGGGFSITVDNESSSDLTFLNAGTISGVLDVIITNPNGVAAIDFTGEGGNVRNLTINHASCVATIQDDTTLDGDLTITAGELNTKSGSNHALTVAGNTVVTGTLTGNNSTLVFGTDGVHGSTESGALHVESSGSLTFGSGDLTAFSGFTAKGTNTVTSTGGGDILIKGRTNNGFMNSHGHTGVNITGDYKILYDNNSLHDIRNNMSITAANIIYSVSNRTYKFWTTSIPPSGSHVTFTGNLQVSNSTTTLNTQETGRRPTQTFTVSGDTTLDGTLIGNSTEISTGSLTINSGGTYDATSETTTITNKSSSNYMFFDAGTFNHNKGTVHFKADTSSGTWFAVKGHSTEETTEFFNVTTERVGSSTSGYRVCVGGANQFFVVRNNLTIGANSKIFSGNGSSILRQSGIATLNGELDLDNFTDIEMGAVTINSGGALEFDNGSITIKAESFRNVGGTVNA